MSVPYLWQTGEPGPDGLYVVKQRRGDPTFAEWSEVDNDLWAWITESDADIGDVVAWVCLPDDDAFTPGYPPVGVLAIVAYTVNGEPRVVVDRLSVGGIEHYAEDGGDPDAEVVITGWHPLPSETP